MTYHVTTRALSDGTMSSEAGPYWPNYPHQSLIIVLPLTRPYPHLSRIVGDGLIWPYPQMSPAVWREPAIAVQDNPCRGQIVPPARHTRVASLTRQCPSAVVADTLSGRFGPLGVAPNAGSGRRESRHVGDSESLMTHFRFISKADRF
ncbi:hypothetical protein LSH36_528g00009 [Paralvinella palmiformis]|uniref:Uncharacterized protein n=1 Tax=Paralvinella palmiformis TaxID=53620 RepID=A0AAD9MYR4_9ANNE|nr:hypothetical protein LSH36_528g00009 [Paralvinella palmiformis]